MRRRVPARPALTAAVALSFVVALGGCSAGSRPSVRATVEAPSMTTIPDGVTPPDATVTVPRLDPPEARDVDVTRLTVDMIDDTSGGSSTESGPAAPVRAGRPYLLTGRCLPRAAGGTLVVDVLGPSRGGSSGAPSQPMSGPKVATITLPCDGTEARLTLRDLPAGSGELMVSDASRQVATGWVVLAGEA